jgi:hypothetical protein
VRGRFVGFLMAVVDIDSTSEVECILQEKQARREGLPTGLGAKVTLAANLATVIAALHRQRHYVVDLKPVNLRFYRQSLYMAMLDCDGFSIQGKGERFEAPQITPDYLAPEFHGRALTGAGEAQQDRFALAVVIFQLLNFGIHPFTGRPTTERVPTDIPGRIAGRWYAYGLRPNPSLQPSPSSSHATMPGELRALFDRAFEGNAATRPSADEWGAVLREYAQRSTAKLVSCQRDHSHQHFAGQPCAACARVTLLAGAQAAAASRARTSPQQMVRALRTRVPAALARAGHKPPPNPPWPTPPSAARPPSNWPAPMPMSTSTPSSSISLIDWMRLIPAAVALLILLVVGISESVSDWLDRREAQARLEAKQAQVAAQAAARPVAVAPSAPAPEPPRRTLVPEPAWYELGDYDELVHALTGAMAEGNAYAIERGVGRMRAQSRNRHAAWEKRREAAIAKGANAAFAGAPGAYDAARDLHLSEGRNALTAGEPDRAKREFLYAMWLDADSADAWFGYGLAVDDSQERSGAIAFAFLLAPDARTAQARCASFEPRAAPAAGESSARSTLRQAAAYAERVRMRLAGTMPQAERVECATP